MNQLPATPETIIKKAPACCHRQYRSLNIKTTSKEGLEMVMKACLEKPAARVAWMEHPSEGETPVHYHLAGSFMNPVRLSEALAKLCILDPHCYIKPCRNFRSSVRYLAHLDNPEKVQLNPGDITLAGDWEGVNLANLFERRGASASLTQLVDYLADYRAESGCSGFFEEVPFALWLDSHGYSSAKSFAMLRLMGLSWDQLVTFADTLVASRTETPNPDDSTSVGEPLAAAGA